MADLQGRHARIRSWSGEYVRNRTYMYVRQGRHARIRSWSGHEIQKVLDCLESIPEVQAPVQVFSAVKLMHEDFLGAQIIHSAPFKSRHSAPRMVRCYTHTRVYVQIRTRFVRIRTYTYIFVHYSYIFVHIRTYSYIFVHIRFMGPMPAHKTVISI
jgi:hypothetical protein